MAERVDEYSSCSTLGDSELACHSSLRTKVGLLRAAALCFASSCSTPRTARVQAHSRGPLGLDVEGALHRGRHAARLFR
eukprot:2637611-Pleurochrysis_carterae.AAC.1